MGDSKIISIIIHACIYVPMLGRLCIIICRYYVIQYNKIFHIALQWHMQQINQNLNSQTTPYISSSRASYRLSIVRSVEKTDCVITAPRCSMFITKVRPESPHLVLPYLHAVPPNASLCRNERKGGASRALHGAN